MTQVEPPPILPGPSEGGPAAVQPSTPRARMQGTFGALALAAFMPAVWITWFLTDSWRAGIASGLTTSLTTLLLLHWFWAFVRRGYLAPMQDAIGVLRDVRQSQRVRRLVEQGAPLGRALLRAVNDAAFTLQERCRLSQANLLAMEVAFDRIHSVLHALSEGVLVIDVEGELVLANRFARRLLRDDGRPLEGRPLKSLLEPSLADAITEGLTYLGNERTRDRVKLVSVPVGAGYYDIAVVRVASERRHEEFGWVIALLDVTQSHELARMKDEFLSSISHEMRTPLTSICAFAEILAQCRPEDDAEWNEFVGIIGAESRRLAQLVDDVLESTELDSGAMRWCYENFDVTELLRATRTLFDRLADGRGIRIELTGDPRHVLVAADRQRVREVLNRLLDNALKFNPPGSRIELSVRPLSDRIELGVADAGPGIPADKREQVFERFRQLGDSLTGKPAGSGLGLSICRQIVEHQGGRIWCQDTPLGGIEFCFTLPTPEAAERRRRMESSYRLLRAP
jgi:signal transduction histidine kinase